jgi:hypothetical protein
VDPTTLYSWFVPPYPVRIDAGGTILGNRPSERNAAFVYRSTNPLDPVLKVLFFGSERQVPLPMSAVVLPHPDQLTRAVLQRTQRLPDHLV